MGKPTATTSHAEMNSWVREAVTHAGLSYQRLADILTGRGIGTYDRSMVQKMTTRRRVRLDEAQAISEITGYPLPAAQEQISFAAGYSRLDPEQRALVDALMGQLLASKERQ